MRKLSQYLAKPKQTNKLLASCLTLSATLGESPHRQQADSQTGNRTEEAGLSFIIQGFKMKNYNFILLDVDEEGCETGIMKGWEGTFKYIC